MPRKDPEATRGAQAYRLRRRGATWREVAETLGVKLGSVVSMARAHALDHGKPWPIRLDREAKRLNYQRAADYRAWKLGLVPTSQMDRDWPGWREHYNVNPNEEDDDA